MKSLSLPGQRARSRGFFSFTFGNALTTLKGGGGSGDPTTREVLQGVRGLAGSAAEGSSHATVPTTSIRGNAEPARNSRQAAREVNGMNLTPQKQRTDNCTTWGNCPFRFTILISH